MHPLFVWREFNLPSGIFDNTLIRWKTFLFAAFYQNMNWKIFHFLAYLPLLSSLFFVRGAKMKCKKREVKREEKNYRWCVCIQCRFESRLLQKPLLKLLYAALSIFSTRLFLSRLRFFFAAGTKIRKFFSSPSLQSVDKLFWTSTFNY